MEGNRWRKTKKQKGEEKQLKERRQKGESDEKGKEGYTKKDSEVILSLKQQRTSLAKQLE